MKDFFYIAGGIVGGWLIARRIFGTGASYRRNPDYTLNWLDDDGEPSKFESDVLVDGKVVGSIVMLLPKKWSAYNEKLIPIGEFENSAAAAKASYNKWSDAQFSPTITPVKVPDWVADVEVEPTTGKGERFIVWVGDDRGGIIEKRGGRYDAYIDTKWGTKQLEIGVSRKRAIQAVYVAWKILDYLPRQTIRGKKVSYSPRRFKTLPPKKRGQRPRRVEKFRHKHYFVQKSAFEMSKSLGIPEKEIILYGKKLAEMLLIYGIFGKEKQRTTTEDERSEKVIPPYKHFPIERRKRQTIVEKKLPRIRTKTAYRFAMVGPQGEVGFGAG